jgi:hypothetical protein
MQEVLNQQLDILDMLLQGSTSQGCLFPGGMGGRGVTV